MRSLTTIIAVFLISCGLEKQEKDGFKSDGVLVQNQEIRTPLDFLNEVPFDSDGEIKGIGIVERNMNKRSWNNTFVIYDVQRNPIGVVKHTMDDVVTQFNGKDYHSYDSLNPFRPKLFIDNPDYFRLAFHCLSKTNEGYEVIIDEKTNRTGYIAISDSCFVFNSFAEYVSHWADLGIDFDRTSNPLREKPYDQAPSIASKILEEYKIWRAEKIEMKGDWMKVRVGDKEEGWIRWLRGRKIVIRLYFAC